MKRRNLIIIIAIIIIAIGILAGAYYFSNPEYESYENDFFSVDIAKSSGISFLKIDRNDGIGIYSLQNANVSDRNYMHLEIWDGNNTNNDTQSSVSTVVNRYTRDRTIVSEDDHSINGNVYKKIDKDNNDKTIYSYVNRSYDSDDVYIIFEADNLDSLKVMVETFKLKKLDTQNITNSTNTTNTTNNTSKENYIGEAKAISIMKSSSPDGAPGASAVLTTFQGKAMYKISWENDNYAYVDAVTGTVYDRYGKTG